MQSLVSDAMTISELIREDLSFIRYALSGLRDEYDLVGLLFCLLDIENYEVELIAGDGLDEAPLIGGAKESLKTAIIECYKTHPEPHMHKISDDFKKSLEQSLGKIDINHRMIYIPAGNEPLYAFLAFTKPSSAEKLKPNMVEACESLAYTTTKMFRYSTLNNQQNVLERYVKEVGHDIASSVQATVAKLRNISRGIYGCVFR